MKESGFSSALEWGREHPASSALGPVVLECRNRSFKERSLASGQDRYAVFVVIPFAGSTFPASGALILYGLVWELMGRPPGWMNERYMWLVVGTTYVVSCAVILRLILRRSPKAALVLHRDGIRYRGKTFHFADLIAIHHGRVSRGVEATGLALMRLIGKFNPIYRQAVETANINNAASLTFVLKDGRSCSLKGVGILCEPQDYSQFLDLVRRDHPQLFEHPELSPAD